VVTILSGKPAGHFRSTRRYFHGIGCEGQERRAHSLRYHFGLVRGE
jgi:hypothetical protein